MTLDPATIAILTGATRAVVYGAAAIVVGAAVFDAGVARQAAAVTPEERAAARARARRLGRWAAVALLSAYAARLYIQVVDSFLVAMPTMEMIRQLLFSTRAWGLGVLAQLIISAGIVAIVSSIRRSTAPAAAIVLLTAPLAAVSVPLTGHAVGHGGFAAVAVQSTHVLAVGSWLGTLAVLWLVCRREMRAEGLVSVIRAFSPVALASAAMVAVAGTGAILVHVGSPRDLVSTSYGLVLLVKIALFLSAAGIGYVNWRHVTPQLARGGSREPFTRAALIEIALGAVAIMATALLTSLPQPGE